VSGSGNVRAYTVEAHQLGAKVVTLSDSGGTIYDKDGNQRREAGLDHDLKNNRRGRIKEYAAKFTKAEYLDGKRPWHIKAQCAFPSATQNEISGTTPRPCWRMAATSVGEGANMPTTPEGVEQFLEAKILYGPGKAANAGGVATSGLEMSQNSMRLSWTRDESTTA